MSQPQFSLKRVPTHLRNATHAQEASQRAQSSDINGCMDRIHGCDLIAMDDMCEYVQNRAWGAVMVNVHM